MQRSQSKRILTRPLLFSKEKNPCDDMQQTYITINNSNQFPVPIEKGRALSHKKLSLTSTMFSQPQYQTKKITYPVFEANRFIRPVLKSGVHVQLKKQNEDSKSNLKISSYRHKQLHSSTSISMLASTAQSTEDIDQNQNSFEKQLMQYVNQRIKILNSQISSQSSKIIYLQQKITELQYQLSVKSSQLCQIRNKSDNLSQLETSDIFRRLIEVQDTLNGFEKLSNQQQSTINKKLYNIENKLILNGKKKRQHKELQDFIFQIRDLSNKVSQWCLEKEKHLQVIEFGAINKLLVTLPLIKEDITQISSKIKSLEDQLQRSTKQRNGDTKDSIHWQTFEDYNLTSRSERQIKNISIFSHDDFFFHPTQTETNVEVKTSCVTHTPSFGFQELVSVMDHLHKFYLQRLPIKCTLDRHKRLHVVEQNKLLINQQNKCFYKVDHEGANILQERGYIKLLEVGKFQSVS